MLTLMLPWWTTIKNDYGVWREQLHRHTATVLQSVCQQGDLATLNGIGVHHMMSYEWSDEWNRRKIYYEKHNKADAAWLALGSCPGLWCALFDPCNCFSFSNPERPMRFMSFQFRKGFRLFDPKHKDHQQQWLDYDVQSSNNSWSESMVAKMKRWELPWHSAFWSSHSYGAAVGYSDYLALVLIDVNCIDSIVFTS